MHREEEANVHQLWGLSTGQPSPGLSLNPRVSGAGSAELDQPDYPVLLASGAEPSGAESISCLPLSPPPQNVSHPCAQP